MNQKDETAKIEKRLKKKAKALKKKEMKISAYKAELKRKFRDNPGLVSQRADASVLSPRSSRSADFLDKCAMLGKLTERDVEIHAEDENQEYFGRRLKLNRMPSRQLFCARYKAKDRPCVSKRKERLTLKDEKAFHSQESGGKKRRTNARKGEFLVSESESSKLFDGGLHFGKEVYVTDQGTHVHASYFGEKHLDVDLRCLHSDEVSKKLREYLMCPKCTKHYGNKSFSAFLAHEYIDITRKSQCCVICKKSSQTCASNRSQTQVPVCNECLGKKGGVKGHEKQLHIAMEYLKCVFPSNKFKMHREIKTGGGINLDGISIPNRFADFLISFEDDDHLGIVIIECDENSHASYNIASETAKFIQQAAEIIKDFMTVWVNKGFEVKKVKTLYIRYNPNSPYHVNGRQEGITPEARLLTIRQQIIAWKRRIKAVRHFTVMFAFLEGNRKAWYPVNYKGCGMIYNCPAPEKGSDWEYCADITELYPSSQLRDKTCLLADLQRKRVKWSQTFQDQSWSETSTTYQDRYPVEIRKRLCKHFPELAD